MPGHEVCAEVVALGAGTESLEVGDIVSAESHIPCASQGIAEECNMCRMGNAHIWWVAGCRHARYQSGLTRCVHAQREHQVFLCGRGRVPRTVRRCACQHLVEEPQGPCVHVSHCVCALHPLCVRHCELPLLLTPWCCQDMPHEIVAMQESLGNSVYTVSESNVEGKDVVIFGLGPTGEWCLLRLHAEAGRAISPDVPGQNCIPVCKAMGARKVIAVAGSTEHISLAKKVGGCVSV